MCQITRFDAGIWKSGELNIRCEKAMISIRLSASIRTYAIWTLTNFLAMIFFSPSLWNSPHWSFSSTSANALHYIINLINVRNIVYARVCNVHFWVWTHTHTTKEKHKDILTSTKFEHLCFALFTLMDRRRKAFTFWLGVCLVAQTLRIVCLTTLTSHKTLHENKTKQNKMKQKSWQNSCPNSFRFHFDTNSVKSLLTIL